MDHEKTGRTFEIRSFIEACHNESWPFLTTLTEKDAGQVLYQDDEYNWNIHNLLSHLADAERGMLGQIKLRALIVVSHVVH